MLPLLFFCNIARLERVLTRVSVTGFWKCVLQGLILTRVSGNEWLIVHSVCTPPTKNYLSQLSCHIIKGKEQSGSFVSSHFWGDKEGTFFWLKKKTKLFFFLCLPPLSGGLILLNFNIWSSNRCILELCTPWTKTEPHPQQLFNWQISSLSLAYKNTQTTSENICFMLKFSVLTSQRSKLSIQCIYIYQTKVQVGY